MKVSISVSIRVSTTPMSSHRREQAWYTRFSIYAGAKCASISLSGEVLARRSADDALGLQVLSQALGRGFESRRPLQFQTTRNTCFTHLFHT